MMAVFDVPTLSRVLTTPFEQAVYVNGELRQAGMVISCPGCHNIIRPDDLVETDEHCEPIEMGVDEHMFRQFVPGPVEVTIWHADHRARSTG